MFGKHSPNSERNIINCANASLLMILSLALIRLGIRPPSRKSNTAVSQLPIHVPSQSLVEQFGQIIVLLVDDHLALNVLSGRLSRIWGDETPTLTWTFHLKSKHRISILAADFLATAIETKANVHIAEDNIGRTWHNILADTNVTFYVYNKHDLQ